MFNELNNMRLFFEEPSREFNVREIARLLKISPATASKYLKEMEKAGLLKEREERMLKLYRADMESDYYRDAKVFYNIRKIRNSGLIKALNRFYLMPSIIMFGSCASGMDTETSDVDLLVISEKTQEFSGSGTFERKMNRKVHIFCSRNIKDLKNEHLANNISNGIMIQGSVKWI